MLTGAVARVSALGVAVGHHTRANTVAREIFGCSYAEGSNGKDLLTMAK